MTKREAKDLIKQDIKDINGLVNYEKYGLKSQNAKILARGIILNLKEHLEDFIR